ncbi:ABC transporter ATP-binding protein [Clostridium cochlearium]|uniref:ABC transporter ATP-binding protein n=1 Tax=Clostridium cochlearium TaxID=1494 RepID=A0A240ACB5_CLOCO|nr:ABC transporter ATP-binding protein [Clostridium cochlearium]MBV1821096.1 ABC transporter ATP-binding protein [Bacteroidales bacterium MSK.15.36]NSJ92074.1 ABC transporter ATP-binding protein [Coprococcus sp. MSK.21.13]MBE6065254.1 ABC transporter ATP-binding protein [Clostridium cochlearium]MCG4572733.1 ABC transporter ATP-binding protein [Clostridium cochlearium]MCG4580769.1 ABC transporter ATP-binding protein [Clostridium cochlearium]
MELAVKIEGLNKIFNKKKVLDNLSLEIEEDKIYGLVGKNGAGKSTLLKIISCYYVKNSGKVEVFGEEPFENEKILSQICFTSSDRVLPSYLKIGEILNILKEFYPNWDEKFRKELIKKFELDENKVFDSLSKGMKAMVNLIIGLASRAPLTIYDEPYSGLDPVYREVFYKILLEDYEKNPRTIIFSTHYLDEVSRLFENLIIMDRGRVLLNEEMDCLREKSFYIKGEKDVIEEIEGDLNVINSEVYGNSKILWVFQQIADNLKEELINKNLSIEPLGVQKLFVGLSLKDIENR